MLGKEKGMEQRKPNLFSKSLERAERSMVTQKHKIMSAEKEM